MYTWRAAMDVSAFGSLAGHWHAARQEDDVVQQERPAKVEQLALAEWPDPCTRSRPGWRYRLSRLPDAPPTRRAALAGGLPDA